jgi:hypothetical protein
MPDLGPERLTEIRRLRPDLPRTATERDLRALLARYSAAVRDLLDDREDLVRANAEAAEELVGWNGAL